MADMTLFFVDVGRLFTVALGQGERPKYFEQKHIRKWFSNFLLEQIHQKNGIANHSILEVPAWKNSVKRSRVAHFGKYTETKLCFAYICDEGEEGLRVVAHRRQTAQVILLKFPFHVSTWY